jgi:hypothetical protein
MSFQDDYCEVGGMVLSPPGGEGSDGVLTAGYLLGLLWVSNALSLSLSLSRMSTLHTAREREREDLGAELRVLVCGCMQMFMGVSALTERLMEAIAVITSKSRWVYDDPDEDGQPTQVEVLAWNPTVANLTLMAIGSSAPEILLSTVELTAGRGFSGDLGPMTIVGSAAFNLLLVSAICVTAVPDGETRKVQNHSVFFVTGVRSHPPPSFV